MKKLNRYDRLVRQSMADVMRGQRARAWRGVYAYDQLTPGARRAANDTLAYETLHYMVERCDAACALHLAAGEVGLAYAAARLSVAFRASGARMFARHDARRAAELEAAE